ncbi:MAG: hypothetical protein M3335_00610 [Actinomycetota bacterium]|nr:hypothetical protein [Actinomycetota bacterium]
MPLSDDQKAILRLLSQRGEQGYEDLSALMGIGVDEVHARARAAGEALEAEGIPAPPIPSPPGGGGGGSPSGAKDGEAPAGEPPPPAVPEVPRSTEAPRARPKAAAKPKAAPPSVKMPEGKGLWAAVAAAAAVVLVVILLVSGGGDDSGSTETTAADTTAAETTTAAPTGTAAEAAEQAAAREGKEVTKAVLNPVDGSEARGEAVFGRVKKNLALQVLAEGLEQTDKGESYTIWLAASPEKMLPLASTQVGKEGQISAQVQVPVEILAYLASETFGEIAITKTEDSQLEASLAEATKAKEAPAYTGDEVLRGEVTGPIVGAAKAEEGE